MTFYRKSSWKHIVIVETLDTGPLPALSSLFLISGTCQLLWLGKTQLPELTLCPGLSHSLLRHELGLVWALASWLTLGCPPRLAQEEMRVKEKTKILYKYGDMSLPVSMSNAA